MITSPEYDHIHLSGISSPIMIILEGIAQTPQSSFGLYGAKHVCQ